jgi:type IV secretion system pilin
MKLASPFPSQAHGYDHFSRQSSYMRWTSKNGIPMGLFLKLGCASFIMALCCITIAPLVAQAQSPAAARPSADLNPLFKPNDLDGKAPKITLPRFSNLFDTGDSGETVLQKLLDFIVDTFSLIIGVTAFIYLIYGGFLYMMSGGAPDGVEQAKKTIRSAIVGIIIAAFSYLIVTFIIEQILTATAP